MIVTRTLVSDHIYKIIHFFFFFFVIVVDVGINGRFSWPTAAWVKPFKFPRCDTNSMHSFSQICDFADSLWTANVLIMLRNCAGVYLSHSSEISNNDTWLRRFILVLLFAHSLMWAANACASWSEYSFLAAGSLTRDHQ